MNKKIRQLVRIARIEGNGNVTYRVEKLNASTTYDFRIQGFNFKGNTPVYSKWSYLSGKTNPNNVSGFRIGGTAKDALRVNWNKIQVHQDTLSSNTKEGSGTELPDWKETQ